MSSRFDRFDLKTRELGMSNLGFFLKLSDKPSKRSYFADYPNEIPKHADELDQYWIRRRRAMSLPLEEERECPSIRTYYSTSYLLPLYILSKYSGIDISDIDFSYAKGYLPTLNTIRDSPPIEDKAGASQEASSSLCNTDNDPTEKEAVASVARLRISTPKPDAESQEGVKTAKRHSRIRRLFKNIFFCGCRANDDKTKRDDMSV